LPLNHLEPFAATLGVMLYPGVETAEQRRARVFATHYLGNPPRQIYEVGGRLPYEDLVRIATDASARLDDLDKRWWGGTATGHTFKAFFVLWNTEPPPASWNSVIRLAEIFAGVLRESGARSYLWTMWLTGRLAPDHKSIADLRKDNGPAICNVCTKIVALCRQLDRFADADVAIDGSKFKADAMPCLHLRLK
jgi:hypothetical protein